VRAAHNAGVCGVASASTIDDIALVALRLGTGEAPVPTCLKDARTNASAAKRLRQERQVTACIGIVGVVGGIGVAAEIRIGLEQRWRSAYALA